jgi:hypothetical protein
MVAQSDQGRHQCPCQPQMCQDWPTHADPTQCLGSLCADGTGLHRKLTTGKTEIHRKLYLTVRQECRPVWPTHADPTQCLGSLCAVGIGLHRKLTIFSTENIQINDV